MTLRATMFGDYEFFATRPQAARAGTLVAPDLVPIAPSVH